MRKIRLAVQNWFYNAFVRHPLGRRRWIQADGSIVSEALNVKAFRLLRDKPEQYFRRRPPKLFPRD